MENKKQRKNWRDSKLVEIAAWTLIAGLNFGAYKSCQELDKQIAREFKTKYGYLVGQPKDYQFSVIYSNVNHEMGWWNSNQSTRDWVVKLNMDQMKKLEQEKYKNSNE